MAWSLFGVGVDPLWWTIFPLTNRDRHASQQTSLSARFRAQIISLTRAGRSVPELAREFEPCEETIYAWLKQADRTGNGGYRELRVAVRLMLQTSADRGVVFAGRTAAGEARGFRVCDARIFQEEGGEIVGEVFLPDPKTKDRPLTVPMTDALCRELLVLTDGKGADDAVFSVSYQQVDAMWRRVRDEAKLKWLRIKDLRSVAAIYGERAGVPLTVMARTLGHGDESMTRRYQQH